ncbi:MAG: hypothetical protein HFI34_09135 [Lachnospiraceae bacterium]|nr:hypothetical protein [Lachnospiraceae bacterium]
MLDNKFKICINSIATEIPDNRISKMTLADDLEVADESGIEQICVANKGELTTEMATRVVKKSIENINPKSIDELVCISEGISDYLYMDTSKSILRNIGGRDDDVVYTYDICTGNCGTIKTIQFVGNQLISNKNISTAIITSSLLWDNHSNKRKLGPTYLGDAAGSVVLQTNIGKNEILSIAYESISKYNLVAGFKYGGTKYELPKEALENGEFTYGILDDSHLAGIIECSEEFSVLVGRKAIEKSGLSEDEIDYIGIAGFSKKINNNILSKFNISKRIDLISNEGFLGTVGAMRVLAEFINNTTYKKGDVLLVISNGIDCNMEAMVIQK